MSGTSSDDITGHLFAYGLAYRLLAQSSEDKALVSGIINRIVGYIVKNHYYYIDIDGKPTKWGKWAPARLNDDFNWASQRGPNSIEIISYLSAAFNATGNALYRDQISYLLQQEDYWDNILNTKVTAAWNVNYGDDELGLMSHFLLLFTNLFDANIMTLSRKALSHYWPQVKTADNPFYTFLCALVAPSVAIDGSIETLRKWPLELIDWPIDNVPRMDYRPNPDALLDSRVAYGSVNVLPSNQRPLIRNNDTPLKLVGGSGFDDQDPGAWLLGYWMGRHYGFIQ